MRAEPSHRSEMVSQILFGEIFQLLEKQGGWVKVRMHFDSYEGWIDERCFEPVENGFLESYLETAQTFVDDYSVFVTDYAENVSFPVFRGSLLPLFKNGIFHLGERAFECNESYPTIPPSLQIGKIIPYAMEYLGTPYLWGGRSPVGIDCSGLVQMVFCQCGAGLPRDAYQQAELGTTISFVDECVAGDLLFFDNAEGKITHVGIATGTGEIIHASGWVRKDLIDHQGIFNRQLNTYTHNLRLIKRLD